MKVLVLGNAEAVRGFSLAGVEGKPAETADEINLALDAALADRQIGIIMITSDAAATVPARVENLKLHSTIPLVVEIPAPHADEGEQGPSLSEVVFRAIGVRI